MESKDSSKQRGVNGGKGRGAAGDKKGGSGKGSHESAASSGGGMKGKAKGEGEGGRGGRGPPTRPSHRDGGREGNGGKGRGSSKENYYDYYQDPLEVEKMLERGTVHQGIIRVTKFDGSAYVTVSGLTIDVCIEGDKDRNRALHGDVVVVELHDRSKWKNLLEQNQSAPPKDSKRGKDTTKSESLSVGAGGTVLAPPSVAMEDIDVSAIYDDSEEGRDKKKFVEEIAALSIANRGDTTETLWRSVINIEKPAGGKEGEGVEKGTELPKWQPTGKVISILERHHKLDYVGQLVVPQGVKVGCPVPAGISFIVFKPYDAHCPFMRCPFGVVPQEFLQDPHSKESTLYSARLGKWDESNRLPEGLVRGSLGEAGEIAAETEALISEFGVNHGDFTTEVLDCLTHFTESWSIPEEEIRGRRDLRNTRVFSIDPTTARDLDDAMHITPLEDGTFEIGVHIADVSYFIEPTSALDREAARRATTVYLVQMIIPMLPRILCEQLCSLNPGVDRLAYSCIFRMTKDGDLTDHEPWYGRTIIHSCSKLDYGTAQHMIEGSITVDMVKEGSVPLELWEEARRPVMGHTMTDVIKDVLNLHTIAKERRRKRYANGALSLNKGKLSFERDADGNPVEVFEYPIKESNQLIEEYMLLANYLVAEKLILHAKSKAFLRKHPVPDQKKIIEFGEVAKRSHVDIDTSCAGSLQTSLKALSAEDRKVWEWFAINCMNPAVYFPAGDDPPSEWRHYALAIPYYTHFTSPIRRYADVMVHRLLTESLHSTNAEKTFPTHLDVLSQIAEHCNEKKLASRKAQERSGFIYLCVYLKAYPQRCPAIVLEVSYARFKIIVPAFSYEHLVYIKDICKEEEASWDADARTLTVPSSAFKEAADPAVSTSNSKVIISFLTRITVLVTADKEKRPTVTISLLSLTH